MQTQLGKVFRTLSCWAFSTEAERKHVRVKEAEGRDETSCLWVTNTFEIADIKVWRMWSTLSLFLFFSLRPMIPTRIKAYTQTHTAACFIFSWHIYWENDIVVTLRFFPLNVICAIRSHQPSLTALDQRRWFLTQLKSKLKGFVLIQGLCQYS